MPDEPLPAAALNYVFGPSAKMHRTTGGTAVDGWFERDVADDELRHSRRKFDFAAARAQT
jgi:hypothetical protein